MIRHIRGPVGHLEALIDDPGALCTTGDPSGRLRAGEVVPPRAAVVLAHPHPLYGGTMHTKAVFQAAKAFCRLGCAVLRFNFRGVGSSQGTFDEGRGELDDFRAAVKAAAERFPGIEVWAAGVSFGAFVAMNAGATDERASTLIGLATPVDTHDYSLVRDSAKLKIFIHGERDELCPLLSVRRLYAHAAEPKELVVIDAAGHLFDGRLTEMAEAIEDLLG